MRRVNISLTDRQYQAIQKNAKALEIKAGTFCKLCSLSAAGVQYIPDSFTMPTKIKQLDLFKQEKKRHD